MPSLRICRLFLAACLLIGLPAASHAEIRTQYHMDHDPELEVKPEIKGYSPKLAELWLQALARPEGEMQRSVADAIARGHAAGMPGLEPAAPRLVELVVNEKSHPAVRLAAAKALASLAAKETTPELMATARKAGTELRLIVEPALADWKAEGFIPDWMARLSAANPRPRDLILAIRCLGTIGHTPAVGRLLELVHDTKQRADVRTAAARAAGQLRDQGNEPEVRKLIAGAKPSVLNRLCAVELLVRHAGTEPQELLLKFAVDPEPAIARIALARLLEIDTQLVIPIAEASMNSPDVHVRTHGSTAYIANPTPERMAVLAKLMDDPHPDLRRSISSSLLTLTKRPELDQPIRNAAVAMLGGPSWRGQEQSALLLGSLDHEAAAARLFELLDSPRAEVEVASAWAIKSLEIAEMLPMLLEKAQERTALKRKPGAFRNGDLPRGIDEETAHIFELFGKLKYTASEPLMRDHVAKQFELGEATRAAAIWNLGIFHAGVPDQGLANKFMERINDMGPPPDMPKVVMMCFVSLGRMKAVSKRDEVRSKFNPDMSSNQDSEIRRWAVMQLFEEDLPPLRPRKHSLTDWFLTPLDE
ncbi:MAG: HEAT repeat domain-containing protein [Planctomycetes bacterium]|nr:HEAT repeat domain-containing protein [Planctomycetota bacterium]